MTSLTSTRILVAVDDSPAALEGVRVAVDLARHSGAQLRCVHVLVDGELLRALGKVHHDGTELAQSPPAILPTLKFTG